MEVPHLRKLAALSTIKLQVSTVVFYCQRSFEPADGGCFTLKSRLQMTETPPFIFIYSLYHWRLSRAHKYVYIGSERPAVHYTQLLLSS